MAEPCQCLTWKSPNGVVCGTTNIVHTFHAISWHPPWLGFSLVYNTNAFTSSTFKQLSYIYTNYISCQNRTCKVKLLYYWNVIFFIDHDFLLVSVIDIHVYWAWLNNQHMMSEMSPITVESKIGAGVQKIHLNILNSLLNWIDILHFIQFM